MELLAATDTDEFPIRATDGRKLLSKFIDAETGLFIVIEADPRRDLIYTHTFDPSTRRLITPDERFSEKDFGLIGDEHEEIDGYDVHTRRYKNRLTGAEIKEIYVADLEEYNKALDIVVPAFQETKFDPIAAINNFPVHDAYVPRMEFYEYESRHHLVYASALLGGLLGDCMGTVDGKPGAHSEMILFTAEGMLRGESRGQSRGIVAPSGTVLDADLRWIVAREPGLEARSVDLDGWLYEQFPKNSARETEEINLELLRLYATDFLAARESDSPEVPSTLARGPSALTRVSPVGLFVRPLTSAGPFRLGREIAALTHGHPAATQAAGCYAELPARLLAGTELREALRASLNSCRDP